MPSSEFEARLKSLLKKTSDDMRRVGTDIKEQAQKLMSQAKDQDTRQRVREKLTEVGDWARKTGEDLARVVETGVTKAEGVLSKATDKVGAVVAPRKGTDAAATTPSEPVVAQPPEVQADEPEVEKQAAAKTIGRSKKKKAGSKPVTKKVKKTIGRKAAAADGDEGE